MCKRHNLGVREDVMSEDNKPASVLSVRRRSVLKAGAVTAIGAGVFSGTASATEAEEIQFCDCVEVCVDREVDKGGDFYVIVATEDGDGYTFTETKFSGKQDFCYEVPDAETQKIVALRPGTSEDEVYCNPNECADVVTSHSDFTSQYTCGTDEFGTFQEIGLTKEDYVTISPCCIECESGEELLVKYEWDDEEGKFVMEGSSDYVTLDPDSVVLDEEGEPVEVCFSTTYCDIDAVVKASNRYEHEPYEDVGGEFCVTAIDKENGDGQYAISNVQFFCEAPDDPSVGNSGNAPGRNK